MNARKLVTASMAVAMLTGAAHAQVPDVLNALDAGGRAMGMGGGTNTTGGDTLSSYYNPAGLGYVTSPTFGFALRNLPEATTLVGGNFDDPVTLTSRDSGRRAITHLGFATPTRFFGGSTVGIAFTTGGFFREQRSGTNLTQGSLTVRNYRELIQIKNDFITVSVGRSAGPLSYGIGLVYALSSVQNERAGELFLGNDPRGNINSPFLTQTGRGLGIQAGVQYQPRNSSLAVGGSIRTPIELSGNRDTASFYDRIPGRISLGVAGRLDNVRGRDDFILWGVQADGYFNNQSRIIRRKRQVVVGGGIEYNYTLGGGARVPIRFGFNAVPAGGDGFTNRNAFTFGLGYRPEDGRYAVDLNFASAGSGGLDLGLGVTYRLGDR